MGEANTAEKLRSSVPIRVAMTEARREIAELERDRLTAERRIETLRRFLRSCDQVAGTGTMTYARHAMSLLRRATAPMTAGQLIDALAAAGAPVRGRSRKHQVTTLAISLKRADGVIRTARGYQLTAATKREKPDGS